MSFHRSKVDLLWSDSGDFCLDAVRKDLADTTAIPYKAFLQQVLTRIQSNAGDWKLQPSIGANLTQNLGQPNTSALGAKIQTQVMNALTRNGFLKNSELKVDVFPISQHELMIIVTIHPSGDREQLRLSLSYSSRDNRVVQRNA